ncbi:hypothetical protein QM600_11325 [Rhodococcus sp. IEGM 1379]|nr:hypothetical protein [Rhodococcus sp. IEGM 1379]MDI9915818.1 hypothetical protein [Rhodococcus sp. IEGM 1379]
MTADDNELLQVERKISRLIARYREALPTEIEQDVRIVHRRFTSGRIRDFVPLLVEKAARVVISLIGCRGVPRDIHGDNASWLNQSLCCGRP